MKKVDHATTGHQINTNIGYNTRWRLYCKININLYLTQVVDNQRSHPIRFKTISKVQSIGLTMTSGKNGGSAVSIDSCNRDIIA